MKTINIVSNTTPLIFLDKVDALQLLDDCFNHVYIPEQVKTEWGKDVVPSFITVQPVSEFGKSYVKGAIGRLHQGELEAIQLATELNCELILLDDLLARRAAERKGLTPLGVLGVLKLACKLNLITFDEINLKILDLINNHGLFISPDTLQQYFDSFSS